MKKNFRKKGIIHWVKKAERWYGMSPEKYPLYLATGRSQVALKRVISVEEWSGSQVAND